MTNVGIDEAATLAAIERCRKIEWRNDPARFGSSMALMAEYLRRSALVAEAVGDLPNWPWFDASARLTLPGVDRRFLPAYTCLDRASKQDWPEIDSLENNVHALHTHFNAIPLGPDRSPPDYYGRHNCWWSIRWASVKSHPMLAPLRLPDLYEPLLVLYERSGSFQTEHGFIAIFHAMMPRGTPAYWITRAPLPSLEWAALDELDREGATSKGKTFSLTAPEQKQLRLQVRRSIGCVSERIHYVLLFSRGHTPDQIAALYEVDESTVHDWLQRFRQHGAKGLDDRPRSGRPRLATVAAQTQAKRALEAAPQDTVSAQTLWTRRLLQRHLAERAGCDLSLPTVTRLIKRLGFV